MGEKYGFLKLDFAEFVGEQNGLFLRVDKPTIELHRFEQAQSVSLFIQEQLYFKKHSMAICQKSQGELRFLIFTLASFHKPQGSNSYVFFPIIFDKIPYQPW